MADVFGTSELVQLLAMCIGLADRNRDDAPRVGMRHRDRTAPRSIGDAEGVNHGVGGHRVLLVVEDLDA